MGEKRLEVVSTFEVLAHVVKNAQNAWAGLPSQMMSLLSRVDGLTFLKVY